VGRGRLRERCWHAKEGSCDVTLFAGGMVHACLCPYSGGDENYAWQLAGAVMAGPVVLWSRILQYWTIGGMWF
jgi:hypothetical protein